MLNNNDEFIDVEEDDKVGKSNAKNPDGDNDSRKVLLLTKWLLDMLGVWPMVNVSASRTEKNVSIALTIFCPLMFLMTIIPAGSHMIFREKDTLERIMILGPVGFCFMNFLKYCSLVFRRDLIKMCVEHVKKDWAMIESLDDHAIMSRNAKVGQRMTIICAAIMYSGDTSYFTILPLLSGNEINELNETVRPLVYQGYEIFVDTQTSPNYEIIFSSICISAFIADTVATVACNLAAVFVAHACGQIEIIMSRLDSLADGIEKFCNSEEAQKRISYVVKSHVRVLRLSSTIEELLREICLVEVFGSTLIICLVEYYCVMEWHNSDTVAMLTYFTILISLSFNIFIFCYIGERLNEQCSLIGKATYMSNWYKLPGKTGLGLIMIIAMANYPQKLTAGGIMELTICSFGSIMKTTLAYLNMLGTMA